jgi:hypothetical protein
MLIENGNYLAARQRVPLGRYQRHLQGEAGGLRQGPPQREQRGHGAAGQAAAGTRGARPGRVATVGVGAPARVALALAGSGTGRHWQALAGTGRQAQVQTRLRSAAVSIGAAPVCWV